MDVTDATQILIQHVQPLKLRHSDPVSQAFIDFYCQCHQGMDYLFPPEVRETIRLVDILQWFCQSIEQGQLPMLIQLMWKDVVGPTLEAYRTDEATENNLMTLFKRGDLRSSLAQWDLERRADGGVNLILKALLADLADIEKAQSQS